MEREPISLLDATSRLNLFYYSGDQLRRIGQGLDTVNAEAKQAEK